MKRVLLNEVLKNNFRIKKVKNLAVMSKKELPVLVKYPGSVWFPSGTLAPPYDGQQTYDFRIVDNKLEFNFLGDPVKYQHSCLCDRAYKYENKIILPQGLGNGYVILTL